MSRCFPYPPPGYLRQGLVKSIKERKEKVKTQGLTKKYKKVDDVLSGNKDDQLEKSDLTEEQGPPVCYISDGSQNSNKRKRETLSSSNECRVNGNIVKIRFSLKKPRVPDASLSEELVCSTSGRADSSTLPKAQEQCDPLSKRPNASTPVPEQKLLCDERRVTVPSSSGASVYDNRLQKAALQYKSLIEDWMPLPLQVELDDDDDNDNGWLFETKRQGESAFKRSEVDSNFSCAGATSYPRAHFLPEAEIYALPYSVPF
ncbi:hypothetical protein PTKIN_Ptkin09bG0104200 [Pterospermum kingtungense]